jgi:hypothetical protein
LSEAKEVNVTSVNSVGVEGNKLWLSSFGESGVWDLAATPPRLVRTEPLLEDANFVKVGKRLYVCDGLKLKLYKIDGDELDERGVSSESCGLISHASKSLVSFKWWTLYFFKSSDDDLKVVASYKLSDLPK